MRRYIHNSKEVNMAIYKSDIKGDFITLRPVTTRYSEDIIKLRTDKIISKYLNKTVPSIEKQNEWLSSQINKNGDYYFAIIDNKTDKLIGTISLYNIDKEDTAEFGRWICIGNSLQSTESVLLLHDFGFNVIKLKKIYSRTVAENTKTLNFHKRFGATQTEHMIQLENSDFTLIENYIDYLQYENIKKKIKKKIEIFK
ncbi:N-acetyltransferase [Halobacteriovorax vibrionivorans]|uniref:N-acetyltransferase n=2 Tax=Halobacteriovoraceae TaxID=1652132 RepID=A0ABY0IMG3_9BACT|nr:N-acetyltransferase [Halobacteriovorax vibrionivorans]TGD49297.1 N-acetyltransferase [Halobacteriovorax sp. Y22]